MKKGEKNKEQNHFSKETETMISNTHILWGKSKEEAWTELEKKIDTVPSAGKIIFFRPGMKIAMAAGIALLIGISALARFYTKTINVPMGQHAEIYLPDNSRINLNAQSTISYKPLLWKYTRTVKFEGEAYFDVMKGKQFEVISGKGKTIVLGTTFNIYSRNSDYQVTCISGKVKVSGISGNQDVILNPGQQTALNAEGTLVIQSDIDTNQTLSWLNNKLSFTSVSLRKVFEEIGRQYGVLINIPEDLEYIYTGTFIKESAVENVLNLVCRPFNLEITRKADNEYLITRNK
ncbi:MAG: FecR domain-containing protein [Bacteroidales bacterium]|jgi:ferric-dicitrate binding protein FerR (iron transport regulator)|nr:FecR domain-containing protein [Bacteroidales bacterium]